MHTAPQFQVLFCGEGTMDTHGDAVNLGDEEIIKNTQFFSEDCNGSQVPTTAEYVPYPSMRPPQVNHSQDNRCPSLSQIPYGHQNAWPNYGPGYGSGVHLMQQLVGAGMYPPFPTGNFSGMVPAYVGSSHRGPPDSFHLSQMGHIGSVPQNAEWLKMRNMNTPVPNLHHRSAVMAESDRAFEQLPLSTRQPASSGGPWICPRSRQRQHQEPERTTGDEGYVLSDHVAPAGNRNTQMQNRGAPQPSELRQSPPPDSAETQQGPRRSKSVDACKTAVGSKDRKCQRNLTTPSQSTGDVENSSKSNTPDSLNQRKALREDEKLYLKEVKIAISEGRVPQVTVVQDEDGNLVRYRSQFLNAFKLAAHAVVQDAYINVNEQETMNEIMEEVRRQFILPQPLPVGMVEGYLKAYFKRRRSQYHQFWIKNGDQKKPDGCKLAAWLQLVEYWKSPEGSKECHQNRRNASVEKPHLKKKKKLDVESFFRAGDVAEVEATGSPGDQLGGSDSLGFDNVTPVTPMTTTRPCQTATRNPMADISNQLHDAVDNILSSFAAKCGSLPSSNSKAGDCKAPLQAPVCQSVKSGRVCIRTTAEVLGSLQRPQVEHSKNEVRRSSLPKLEGKSRMVGKTNINGPMKSEEDGGRELLANFDPKASVNDSSVRANAPWRNYIGEGIDILQTNSNAENNFAVAKEEAVLLSSDASSDGTEVIRIRRAKRNQVCTEGIEGWSHPDSGCAISEKGKEPIIENEKAQKKNQSKSQYLTQSKQKVFVEEEKLVERRGREECMKGMPSKNLELSSRKADVQVNSDAESRSEEENEEHDRRTEEFDDLSEEEEPPVLPRAIVKRKLDSHYGGSSGKKELRGKANKRSSKTTLKKPRVPQIDTSILKKLEFYKRPKNSHPIKTRTRVWVLHPKYVGKVVAEAHAGVNRKSRCVDSANEICKEGQQMISVLRVLYKNTPVMYDKDSRFPKQISYLDQAEGLPNTPVLWCISHLIEIPPLDQITKLLGEIVQPSSQETVNSGSDFEDSRKKRETNSTGVIGKETRRGRMPAASAAAAQVLKGSRTVLRSTNA